MQMMKCQIAVDVIGAVKTMTVAVAVVLSMAGVGMKELNSTQR